MHISVALGTEDVGNGCVNIFMNVSILVKENKKRPVAGNCYWFSFWISIDPLSSSYLWICFFIRYSISLLALRLFSSAMCSNFCFISTVVRTANTGLLLGILFLLFWY